VIAIHPPLADYLERKGEGVSLLPSIPLERAPRPPRSKTGRYGHLAPGCAMALLQARQPRRPAAQRLCAPKPTRGQCAPGWALPGELSRPAKSLIGRDRPSAVAGSLEQLAVLAAGSPLSGRDHCPWLILAVPPQLSLLKVPRQRRAPLAGQGVPGLPDHSRWFPCSTGGTGST